MENRDRKSSPGGHKQGSSPGQGGGDERQRGSDKPAARPAPSGVPNEGRKSEGPDSGQDSGGPQSKGGYEYKGGAQSTGGIPNPDDADDRDSAGSFRGTADDDADANDADEDDGDQAAGSGPNRDKDMNSVFHYPK